MNNSAGSVPSFKILHLRLSVGRWGSGSPISAMILSIFFRMPISIVGGASEPYAESLKLNQPMHMPKAGIDFQAAK